MPYPRINAPTLDPDRFVVVRWTGRELKDSPARPYIYEYELVTKGPVRDEVSARWESPSLALICETHPTIDEANVTVFASQGFLRIVIGSDVWGHMTYRSLRDAEEEAGSVVSRRVA